MCWRARMRSVTGCVVVRRRRIIIVGRRGTLSVHPRWRGVPGGGRRRCISHGWWRVVRRRCCVISWSCAGIAVDWRWCCGARHSGGNRERRGGDRRRPCNERAHGAKYSDNRSPPAPTRGIRLGNRHGDQARGQRAGGNSLRNSHFAPFNSEPPKQRYGRFNELKMNGIDSIVRAGRLYQKVVADVWPNCRSRSRIPACESSDDRTANDAAKRTESKFLRSVVRRTRGIQPT